MNVNLGGKLREKIKEAGNGGSGIIGQFCWYTIPQDVKTDEQTLENILEQNDLKDFMPPKIKAVDAFRRATSRAEKKDVFVDETQTMNILVREVLSDKERVVRHVIREIVDRENVVLDYATIAEIEYDRKNEAFNTKVFLYCDGITEEILNTARDMYKELKTYYESEHIRRMVHNIIWSMQPTSLKHTGSVYFIPQKYINKVKNLGSVLSALGAEFYHVSVLNEENATAAVKENLINQTNKILEAMAKAITGSENKLSAASVGSMLETAKKVVQQIKDYEELLKTDLAEIQNRAFLVQMQMMALLDTLQQQSAQNAAQSTAAGFQQLKIGEKTA